MTGNQDGASRARSLLARLYDRFEPVIEEVAEDLAASPPEAKDHLATQRFVRAIAMTAKTGEAVAHLQLGGLAKVRGPRAEDDMQDDDADDSPEALARMRADLERRLGRVQGMLDCKGLVVEPGCWPTARPRSEPVRTP